MDCMHKGVGGWEGEWAVGMSGKSEAGGKLDAGYTF